MRERLARGWRIVRTGFAFAMFGIGGLLFRLLYFPLLALCVWWPRARRQRMARWAVQQSFRGFVWLMRVLGLLEYRIHGRERLAREGLLVLANHPTLIDVVFLISMTPNATCVVKPAVERNPFMRGPVRATGYLANHSGAALVEDCIATLQAGSNLIIFPEGTRTPVAGPQRLQRGAANIAVRGLRNITPVTIRVQPSSLTKGLPWWRVPDRPMQFTLVVHEDLAVQPFLVQADGQEAVAARQLTAHLANLFQRGGEPPDDEP
jgi:1-acyl-sn-glycerol-3-phosphate acyltransferase